MVDTFALLISHGLLILALVRLLSRDDLDVTPPRKQAPDTVAQTAPPETPARKRSNQWRTPGA